MRLWVRWEFPCAPTNRNSGFPQALPGIPCPALSPDVSDALTYRMAKRIPQFLPLVLLLAVSASAQTLSKEKEASIKADLIGQIDAMKKQAQVMVDSVFSFGELGFQETETSKYLTGILEKEGFKIERGVSGIPTAFVASWGEGKPVISLGSDIDDIPQASQKPGVAYHEPMIEGAPGHGEGHNSGMPLNVIAAIAVKKVMEREHLKGTIRLWPGVAEELVGTKAYYVRDGMFKDVDVVLFTHVGNNLNVSSGGGGSGAARNQIEIMHDLADFGHLRTPRIAEDLFSFDTSRPSRADRHPYHNDDISSHAAGMEEVSFMTDDSSFRSTPALSEAE